MIAARFGRLHCQHQETQYSLRSRVRHLTEDLPRLEQRLEAVRQDLATRQDTSGDRFVMTLEGELVRDRGIAGELLLRRAARMRGSRAERQVGSIAGFQVWIADNFMGGPEILLRAATTYTAKVTDTALGTIRSVEHAIQNLEDLADSLARAITDTRKRLADTQAQVGAPFEYAGRLGELLHRQDEIESALDLTKSQAPSRLESEQPDSADGIEVAGAAAPATA